MTSKTWEVELKFHVTDPAHLQSRLAELGFELAEVQLHEDVYFRHPCREFTQSDEAFRLRRVNELACVTYKGPRRSGPVKTREEIELDVLANDLPRWQDMLEKLGFQAVVPVRKERHLFLCKSDSRFSNVHVTMDCVQGLGDFCEIELIVNNHDSLDSAENRVLELAKRLGLEHRQPKSYLSLLLGKMEP